jgi:hypothetical protein
MGIPTATRQGLLVLQVRAVIEYAVQTKMFVHYQALSKSVKDFSDKELAQALASIMEEDNRAGRPFTCALVVGVRGDPGLGFYTKAKALGCQFSDSHQFWSSQCRALGVVTEITEC